MAETPELESDADTNPEPVEPEPADDDSSEDTGPVDVEPTPAHYHHLTRWSLVLVLTAVWLPADAIGLGLYYWWFHSLDKSWPVFVVLIFVAVCTLVGLLLAMVEGKPLVAAVAIAVMAAPLPATACAAVLHGTYYCEHVSRCFI